jgi:hypothetical protein
MMMHSAQSSMAEKPIATVRWWSYDAASVQHVGRSLVVLVGTHLCHSRDGHVAYGSTSWGVSATSVELSLGEQTLLEGV